MNILAASVKTALVFGFGALLGCGERPAIDGGSDLVDADPSALERGSVRAVYIASRQREAASDLRYAADLKSLTAHNPVQHFKARFAASTIELSPTEAGNDWQFGLSLKGVRCDGRVEAMTAPGKPPVASANRVHYEHALAGAPLTEWYENGALGLEQASRWRRRRAGRPRS